MEAPEGRGRTWLRAPFWIGMMPWASPARGKSRKKANTPAMSDRCKRRRDRIIRALAREREYCAV